MSKAFFYNPKLAFLVTSMPPISRHATGIVQTIRYKNSTHTQMITSMGASLNQALYFQSRNGHYTMNE